MGRSYRLYRVLAELKGSSTPRVGRRRRDGAGAYDVRSRLHLRKSRLVRVAEATNTNAV